MLSVSGIKSFYGETQALFGVSLNVTAGEAVALLGALGCCGVVAHRHRGARGRAGRSAGVRPPGSAGVAQAAVAMPEVSTCVDRTGPADRVQSLCDDHASGAVGDGAGRPSRPQ